ncbi:hypothetical protein [Salinisphaera sp. Q1T1-3]|uniref:hypothetical protein n=1 Tax=Salinisphaera sp. Q1T1-3 TaxID=2321229 RepID=UPI0011C35430|nr:hypothetical protein [Salinisphaera sp. Q1T1-3]
MATLLYFVLAVPAAGTPAMLYGVLRSAGSRSDAGFEGTDGMAVFQAMVFAYAIGLIVILGGYAFLHRRRVALYIGNAVLGLMTFVLWFELARHHVI